MPSSPITLPSSLNKMKMFSLQGTNLLKAFLKLFDFFEAKTSANLIGSHLGNDFA